MLPWLPSHLTTMIERLTAVLFTQYIMPVYQGKIHKAYLKKKKKAKAWVEKREQVLELRALIDG